MTNDYDAEFDDTLIDGLDNEPSSSSPPSEEPTPSADESPPSSRRSLEDTINSAIEDQQRRRGNDGMDEYHERAQASGRPLKDAVRDYVTVEDELRKDFVGGIEYLCQRIGYDPKALIGGLYSRHFGPGAVQYSTARAEQQLEEARGARSSADAEVAEFAKTARYFDELRPAMARLTSSGKATSLKAAYRMALRANPTLSTKAEMAADDARRRRAAKGL